MKLVYFVYINILIDFHRLVHSGLIEKVSMTKNKQIKKEMKVMKQKNKNEEILIRWKFFSLLYSRGVSQINLANCCMTWKTLSNYKNC